MPIHSIDSYDSLYQQAVHFGKLSVLKGPNHISSL
jgi:hypothetical protein